MNLSNHSVAGRTRIEVLIVTIVSAFLICLVILWMQEARRTARSICCNCNLKQVGLAFRIWSGDNNDKNPMQVSITNNGAMERVALGEVFSTFQVMSNELSTPIVLICPGDSARSPAKSFSTNFDDQSVSYFVGLDASNSMWQVFLSGDRNLTRRGFPLGHGVHELTTNQPIGWTFEFHKGGGNLAFGDGSVSQLSSAGLNNALRNSDIATNRIALP